MNDKSLKSAKEIKACLNGLGNLSLKVSKSDRNAWIANTLKRTGYLLLSKKEKTIVLEYLVTMTKMSRQQLSRLIKSYRDNKWIGRKNYQRNCFSKQYTREDILLLAQTDEYHQTLSGPATKKLFARGLNVHHDESYERLASISVSHIYNLRKSQTYLLKRQCFEKTKRSKVVIGERRKPQPNGEAGYVRIDTVHQGDLDKQKGVYHINAVDEVTQYQVVCSVEGISERYLIPILETMLELFPFKTKGFHSDNGSEYINKNVVGLLNKLHIELTKSRARRSNDNAMVESKNGSTVIKLLGYVHITQKWAPTINEFNKKYWVPYLNYHRPCFFAEEEIDQKGKVTKKYPYKNIMTPHEKLKSLAKEKQQLKENITIEKLEKEAMEMTDLEAAKIVMKQREILFNKIFKVDKKQ